METEASFTAKAIANWLRRCSLLDDPESGIKKDPISARDSADELDQIANYLEEMEDWKNKGEEIFNRKEGFGLAFFHAGVWWADRPWRKR
jgi:hypothetical protein